MELCTQEEAHVVCLFPDVPSAEAFEEFVREKSLGIPNRPEIFGHQLVMDDQDRILGEEERCSSTPRKSGGSRPARGEAVWRDSFPGARG